MKILLSNVFPNLKRNIQLKFLNFFQGDYTPSVATYKHAKVRFNFGPKFRHPPKTIKFRPMSARAEEAAIDQTVADMRFFTENEGKLRLDNYSMSAQFLIQTSLINKDNNTKYSYHQFLF